MESLFRRENFWRENTLVIGAKLKKTARKKAPERNIKEKVKMLKST